MLSLITTCKNRLSHLKETLPLMLGQSFSEVIVVDYGCEQGTADWVSRNHSKARIVKVDDDPQFCAARARNIGAGHAVNDVLFFIDADVMLNVDIGMWLKDNLKTGHFYLSEDRIARRDLWGSVICDKISFNKIKGYDEAFREWGGEDVDLYERLLSLGLKLSPTPRHSMTPIEHGDDIRQLKDVYGTFGSRDQYTEHNDLYILIKEDIRTMLHGQIDLETRKAIRKTLADERKRAISLGNKEMKITVDVHPERPRVKRQLVYTIQV